MTGDMTGAKTRATTGTTTGTKTGTTTPTPLRQAWLRYGGACCLTVVAVAGRLALDPVWGRQHNRHLVFLPTVMAAAWFGGFGPGLLTAVLSTLALAHFWSDHTAAAHFNTDLALYLFIAVWICAVVRSLQMARARADAAKTQHERVMELVIHDLRNPLTAIRMAAETLVMDDRPESIRRRSGVITRAADRMDRLVRELFEASQAERGDLLLTVRPEEAQSILQEIVDSNLALAREGGVALDLDHPADVIVVTCDRAQLLRVLANLIGNALRFTPPGGRITLGVQPGDRTARFTVTDSGSGIAPEHLPLVFEPHWKAGGTGAGLGLFIARSIVLAHGGQIGVRSSPSTGTVFWFTIPAPDPATGPITGRRAAATGPG